MPSCLRLLGALAAVLVILAGCTQSPSLPGGDDNGDDTPQDVAEGTCWNGDKLGSDPQDVLKLSDTFKVPYLETARALADRPSFTGRVDCDRDHAMEVYKVVQLPSLDEQLVDYATLLQRQTPLYDEVARSVATGCMTEELTKTAALAGVDHAVMAPALPDGASLGWAPSAPEKWADGQRIFACTLTWPKPEPTRYADLLTKSLPTSKRTCIDSKALVFVDCARKHDRERIAVIEAREAVAAGSFPGPKAIKDGPTGRYLEVPDGRWKQLDAACTAYLKMVSGTKKLTGIANVDADRWPTPTGSYPIYCDADRRPDQEPLVTEGSVYDRG